MGVVVKQSSVNTINLLLGVLVGAVNTLFLYVYFLEDQYYGLITFILSTAFIVKPFLSLGLNFGVIKFFSSCKTKEEKDAFLSMALWFPLTLIIPLIIGIYFLEDWLGHLLSQQNSIVSNYVWHISLVALFTAYFEVFYAWARVQLVSIFGNFLKELFIRLCITLLLILVGLNLITEQEFMVLLILAYALQCLWMFTYALKQYRPEFTLRLPSNAKQIVRYCLYILLAGASANILLDIDKFMIPQKESLEQVAYYAVAVYMGSVIEIPGRAMAQILQPLTAKALNENKLSEVSDLYQKSSINLLIFSGLIFILVNTNLQDIFLLLPDKYQNGIWVVFMISLVKLYHMFLGNNGAIISNSKHYKVLLPYGIIMALSVILLNHVLINKLGIEGAALATLIVIFIFNTVKLYYVKQKFNMQPTTQKTWYALTIIVLMTISLQFIRFPFHALLNIAIKSLLSIALYVFIVLKLNLSEEARSIFKMYLLKKR